MIQLPNGLAMTADDHCYIVGELRQKADKGIALDKPTYHPTAAQAVSAALNRSLRKGVADGSITTLREFIQEQERQRAELEKLIAPMDSVRGCQEAVEAHEASGEGNYTPGITDAEKEV